MLLLFVRLGQGARALGPHSAVSTTATDDTDASRVERKYNNNGYSRTNIRTIVNFIVPVLLLHFPRPWNSKWVIKTISLLYHCVNMYIT